MSSTSATCLVTSPEVLKTKSTFGSFFFQSSIAFFAHQFAPPIHPWSAVGMVTPILICFAAAPWPEAEPPNTASTAMNTAVASFFMVASASVRVVLLPLPLEQHRPDDPVRGEPRRVHVDGGIQRDPRIRADGAGVASVPRPPEDEGERRGQADQDEGRQGNAERRGGSQLPEERGRRAELARVRHVER